MPKKITSARDLSSDDRNANKGTLRGAAMVEESFVRCGAGRSVLADRNGKLIAGNKSTNAFIESGGEDVIVVPTDGTKLVVVQRTDLDLDTDPKARELAYADNRAGEVGLDWANITLEADAKNDDLDLTWMFRNDELASIIDRDFTKTNDAFLEEDEPDDHFDGENTRGERRGDEVELVVICNNETEAKRARREIQELGYYVK